MRPTCTFCARKHLAQAVILAQEAAMGYPEHVWLAIGHMAEASDELVETYPEMANTIREHRKALEVNPAATVPFMDLITAIGKLGGANTYPVAQAHADGTPVELTQAMMNSVTAPKLTGDMLRDRALAAHPVRTLAPSGIKITDSTDSATQSTGVPIGAARFPPMSVHVGGTVPAPVAPAVADAVASGRLSPALEAEARLLPAPGHPDHEKALAAFQQRVVDVFAARHGVKLTPPIAGGPTASYGMLPPAGAAPAPCLTCGDKAVILAVTTALMKEVAKPRLAILTTLADFSPSYSLVGVILEQAHAAILAGYRVFLLVHRGANLNECPPLPPEISLMPVVPTMPWQNDGIDEAMVETYVSAMREWFTALAPPRPVITDLDRVTATMEGFGGMGHLDIITHDLLFQAAYTTFAKAIHELEAGKPGTYTLAWYHMAHSSISARPAVIHPDDATLLKGPGAVARWYRCTLPPGHRLMALNYADVPYLKAYYRQYGPEPVTVDGVISPAGSEYGLVPESIVTLLNSKDIRPFLRMSQTASMLTTKFQLHRADVTVIYPLSLMRAFDKGVDKVLMLLGAMKRLPGITVRLLLITAHANDSKEAPQIIARIKQIAKINGLTTHDDEVTWLKVTALERPIYMPTYMGQDVILTCEALPETAAYGLRADDVRALWGVANLFVFPTTSEAGSLVLMEAALSGCTLVLNQSLPALADYIPAELALWVPWGSIKQPGQPPETFEALDELAMTVWDRMTRNEGMILKRQIMRNHCLEAYGRNLKDILSPPVPSQDEEEDSETYDEVGHIRAPTELEADQEDGGDSTPQEDALFLDRLKRTTGLAKLALADAVLARERGDMPDEGCSHTTWIVSQNEAKWVCQRCGMVRS